MKQRKRGNVAALKRYYARLSAEWRRKHKPKKKRREKQVLLPTSFKELREVDSELADLWNVDESDVWNMFLATGVLR